MSTLSALWTMTLLLSAEPASPASPNALISNIAPLADPFAVTDEGAYALYLRSRKIGELHDTLSKGTFTTEYVMVGPTGPHTVGLIRSKYVRVYSAKDGLLESVTCTMDNPNGRVDGHREGNDIVLNVTVNKTVTQYRAPATRIDDEMPARRLAMAGSMQGKVAFSSLDFFTGKVTSRHASVQSKALRRVGTETLPVYKVFMTSEHPNDSITVFVDSHGNDVEVRLKGGLLVYQRVPLTKDKELPKNPFTASDGAP